MESMQLSGSGTTVELLDRISDFEIVDEVVERLYNDYKYGALDRIYNKRRAKSDRNGKLVSIKEHVKELYRQAIIFNTYYPDALSESEKRLLYEAIYYHDAGKISSKFQMMVTGKEKTDSIPHNYLSALLFLYKNMKMLGKQQLSDSQEMRNACIIAYAVLNHHKRKRSVFFTINEDLLKRYFHHRKLKDILTKDKSLPKNAKLSGDELKFLEEFLENIENLTRRYIDIVRDTIKMRQKNDPDLIRVAGLLIKIDHAASQEGGIVEERPITGDRVRIFEQKVGTPKKFQSEYKDKENVAVVADTGMGKTGLAFLWAKRKMFYVLPNRASANAMYERLKEYAGENKVGLLHSNSLFYLINDINNDDNQDVIKEYDVIRALSKPITVTTADQLFTAVFKYPTYEKIYATLSYSDIVIDEIQAFDPKQIVPILRQMQETIELGARYLLITATLPGIVKKELQQIGIEIIDQVDETIDKTKRHKIKLVDQSIKELVESKLRDYSGKRVLIIVNNVSTAQDLYDFLKEKYKVRLLHSRFTFEDRKQKEEEIKKNEPAIWIATQIVEVSLDIDFDVLFTELAPADSLIQRMGRVWRHRTKDYDSEDLPNIYIACKYDKSKVHQIYEEQLLNKTEELLSQYDGKFLTSEAKRGIVDELYSEKFLRTTQYIEKWKNTASALNLGLYDDKNEAHRIFRNIVNVEVIHEENLGKVERLAKEYKESTTREGRILTLSKINDMKIQIPAHYLLGEKDAQQYHNKHLGVIVVSGQYFKYDKEKGLYIIKRKD